MGSKLLPMQFCRARGELGSGLHGNARNAECACRAPIFGAILKNRRPGMAALQLPGTCSYRNAFSIRDKPSANMALSTPIPIRK